MPVRMAAYSAIPAFIIPASSRSGTQRSASPAAHYTESVEKIADFVQAAYIDRPGKKED